MLRVHQNTSLVMNCPLELRIWNNIESTSSIKNYFLHHFCFHISSRRKEGAGNVHRFGISTNGILSCCLSHDTYSQLPNWCEPLREYTNSKRALVLDEGQAACCRLHSPDFRMCKLDSAEQVSRVVTANVMTEFECYLLGFRFLSDACFNGKHTGQSLRVQFFQWEMICRDDAQ